MCTVSWFFDEDGFELFFNRDELRSRGAAAPPTTAEEGGTRYLAPTDADAGGTWLAVNELGTAVGLLNAHSAAADAPTEAVSRGLLVRRLAGLERASDLAARLQRLDLERRRPFTVVAVTARGEVAVFDWDGQRLDARHPGQPPLLSSSSVDSAGAAAARRELLASLLDAADPRPARLELHRSHRPERGALSPCMHRGDARTVSFCHVRVSPHAVAMAYAPGPPCRTATLPAAEIGRATAAGAAGRTESATVPGAG